MLKLTGKAGLLLSFCFLMITSTCFGWNGAGHKISGGIAYLQMQKENPAALKRILIILKKHPWYNRPGSKWTTELSGLSDELKDPALFMLAATFPDEIKGGGWPDTAIHKDWHYVDYPYVKPGSGLKTKAVPMPNANTAYAHYCNLLSKRNSDSANAVSICWLLHLIGDIHQPLHSIGFFSAALPNGDNGGNMVCIKAQKDGKPFTLHSYWDGLLGENDMSVSSAFEAAKNLFKEYPANKLKEITQNTDFQKWGLNESNPIAKESAYLNGELAFKPKQGNDCFDGDILTKSYQKDALKIAEKRVTLAGIRAATVLVAEIGQ